MGVAMDLHTYRGLLRTPEFDPTCNLMDRISHSISVCRRTHMYYINSNIGIGHQMTSTNWN